MKGIKIILLIGFIASSVYSFTQSPKTGGINWNAQYDTVKVERNQEQNRSISKWFSFVDMYSTFFASTPYYQLYYVFPDTTVNIIVDTTLQKPFIHSVGQVYDLSSPVLNYNIIGTPIFDYYMPTSVDSLETFGKWEPSRFGTIDTLVIRVIPERNRINLYKNSFFTGQLSNYPASNDTTRFRDFNIDTNSWTAKGVVKEYKVPLLIADTLANGLNYIKIATPSLTVNRIFAITIDFIPGDSHLPHIDTLGYNLGGWKQQVTELEGKNTFSNYIPEDYTAGYVVSFDAKYNRHGSGWFGNYIPYLAFQSGQFEAVDINLFLTQYSTLLTDSESEEFNLSIFPNPAMNEAKINFTLHSQPKELSIEIVDLSGKRVYSTKLNSLKLGNNDLEINISALNAGIYFYSLLIDGKRITKKMIVTK